MTEPRITSIEVHEYAYSLHDLGTDYNGFNIALWDLAGKYYQTPIYRLLGGYKERLPCYASTYHGDTGGGLDSPQAYAEFAQHCQALGYRAFKIHGWGRAPIAQEIATVHAVR